jgi:superfamily II DNA or RNA helicase
MPAKLFKPRVYQKEAIDAITEELITNGSNKCLVKMFCGTGKSLIMRTCDVCQNVNLLVYVFPSLSLISQFAKEYLNDEHENNILKISSDDDGSSTTNSHDIVHFLSQPDNKIICITYQSFNTLIDNLGDTLIDVCVFDEAHHAVGQTYQQYIFKDNSHSSKQIFFTATPKNDNGITMYEKDVISDCGKMVYDYTYYRGIIEGHLNPFEIRLDFYTEHNNHSIYESICRSILASGNNRVLTFHSDVNTDRDTSVNNFVNQLDLDQAFNKVLNEEFPEKIGYYSKINILGLSSSIVATCRQCLDKMKNSVHRPTSKHCCRYNILDKFDKTKDTEILIISSCETIGEGIDTKNANMCVFVDPKGSHVSIMQNIGRIVRRNEDRPISTILIPCWVDREKYLNCNGDKEKCDEAIRADLGDQGNFNQILNVLSALKQEDEELYDICLNYPDAYSPQEIYTNLKNQGFIVKDMIGEGQLIENVEYLLDEDLDYENYEDCDTDEEMLARIADEYKVNVEVHTNSLDTPIEKYVYSVDDDLDGEDAEDTLEKKTIRLYKTIDEDTEETIYSPIVEKASSVVEKKQSSKEVHAPDKNKRMNLKVHTNPDIKVLWNISSDFDGLKDVCSCVIDCEVVQYDPMEITQQIVERAKLREENGGNLIPKKCCKNKNKQYAESQLQEHKDAEKLGDWKKALKGKGHRCKCSNEVCDYLDKNLLGWRDEINLEEIAMKRAIEIVDRAILREENEGNLIPKKCCKNKNNQYTEEKLQETKDSQKLGRWKQALKGKGSGSKCSNEVRDYLDENLPGWRDEINLEEIAMKQAIEIVDRAILRKENGGNLIPKACCHNKNKKYTEEQLQETKDTQKLGCWKQALKGKGKSKCSNKVRDYLDENLLGWRDDLEEIAMKQAIEIVERARLREANGGNLIPKHCYNKNKKYTEEQLQEHNDAQKLQNWKQSLKGNGKSNCSNEVRDYLDENLLGWRDDLEEIAMKQAIEIVDRAILRKENGGNLIPKECCKNKNKKYTESQLQEHKDAQKLGYWKQSLKGNGHGCKCSKEVRDYLDKNLLGWRDEINLEEIAMKQAIEIVDRAILRKENGGNLIPKECCHNKNKQYTEEQLQETKDSQKLGHWKQALKGKGKSKCSNEVRDYLDENLLGWRNDVRSEDKLKEKAMNQAVEIVERAKLRHENGGNLMPKECRNNKNKKFTEEQLQERNDAQKLRRWKQALKGKGHGCKCSNEVRDYLDKNLLGWRIVDDVSEENSICEIIADDNSDTEDEIIVFEDDDEVIVFEDDDVIPEPISEPVVKKSAMLQRQKVWQPKQNVEDTQQQTTNTELSSSSSISSISVKQRSECDLTQYHRKYLTMRSNNLGQHFKSNRDEFIEYHRVRNENLKAFELCDQPHMRIIAELDKIKTKRRKHVVDMGCGLARIAEHFKDDTRFEFTNYDHVSTSENITECDISQMPLEDNSIEICIMSMAMWGSNCNEYIMEAYRVLETGMKLYIIDSTKRWSNENKETGIIEEGSEGNRLKNILCESGFQIINDGCRQDKWCLFECIKK